MRIKYGVEGLKIDVTDICFSRLRYLCYIVIPPTDEIRGAFFSDPLFGVHKKIFIEIDGKETVYDEGDIIKINVSNHHVFSVSENEVLEKLSKIHNNLQIRYGSFQEELPEQKMVARFLSGQEKVLEIGGNIGRNSLIIASLLRDDSNLVVLESNPYIANQLVENRDLNHSSFHVENAALSKQRLAQNGWDTKPSEALEDGFFWVNIITYAQLTQKYRIKFDTLVLDCEGAFYYILQDFPEILEGIEWIFVENDYTDIEHKRFVDHVLKKNQFQVIYREGGGFGIPRFQPVWHCFFEVWRRY